MSSFVTLQDLTQNLISARRVPVHSNRNRSFGMGAIGRAGPNTAGGLPTKWGTDLVFNVDDPGTIYKVSTSTPCGGTPSEIQSASKNYRLPTEVGKPFACATWIWDPKAGPPPWPGVNPADDPRAGSATQPTSGSGSNTAAATQARVQQLQAMVSSGQATVFAASAPNFVCPDGMTREVLPDGSSVCIQYKSSTQPSTTSMPPIVQPIQPVQSVQNTPVDTSFNNIMSAPVQPSESSSMAMVVAAAVGVAIIAVGSAIYLVRSKS